MQILFETLQWALLIPVFGGSIYALLKMGTVLRFFRHRQSMSDGQEPYQPPVTLLKPVRGLEKDLKHNLRSACLQDYPTYQVVYSVQDPHDPALPILHELQDEFGSELVSVVISDVQRGSNGKVNNLLGALNHARYETLVISDSDTTLGPNYLTTIIAPLRDPKVGYVCTLFRVTRARRWFEKMELLSINAEFMPDVVFAAVTGASNSSLGPSLALRRSTLNEIGGFESLADYLVEDYELGRRIWASGMKAMLLPHVIDVTVDLQNWRQWWTHQVYWDQNTRLARPGAFFATVLVRSVPFALLYAMVRLADPLGLLVLGGAVAVRVVTTAVVLKWGFRDREGLRSLALLPLRDIVGLFTWALSFTKQTVIWRGVEYTLTRNGRMVVANGSLKSNFPV